MKVRIVKEVIACDVSPVSMFLLHFQESPSFRISSQPKMISQPSVCKMGLKKTLSVQVVRTIIHSFLLRFLYKDFVDFLSSSGLYKHSHFLDALASLAFKLSLSK